MFEIISSVGSVSNGRPYYGLHSKLEPSYSFEMISIRMPRNRLEIHKMVVRLQSEKEELSEIERGLS